MAWTYLMEVAMARLEESFERGPLRTEEPRPTAHIMRVQDRELGVGHFQFVVMRGGQHEVDWSAFPLDKPVAVYAAPHGVALPHGGQE